VRNTWAICPQVEDNPAKAELILDVIASGIRSCLKAGIRKDLSLEEEPASYQLVGGVTAHQGYDG
jgi:hypothetical protein